MPVAPPDKSYDKRIEEHAREPRHAGPDGGREARLLMPAELRRFADLMREA
jgi:hypothetical protein